jgi:hypothetical protein
VVLGAVAFALLPFMLCFVVALLRVRRRVGGSRLAGCVTAYVSEREGVGPARRAGRVARGRAGAGAGGDARSDRERADGAHPPSAESVTHAEPTGAGLRDYAEAPCGCPICWAVAHQCDNRGEGETAPPGRRAERAARLTAPDLHWPIGRCHDEERRPAWAEVSPTPRGVGRLQVPTNASTPERLLRGRPNHQEVPDDSLETKP